MWYNAIIVKNLVIQVDPNIVNQRIQSLHVSSVQETTIHETVQAKKTEKRTKQSVQTVQKVEIKQKRILPLITKHLTPYAHSTSGRRKE